MFGMPESRVIVEVPELEKNLRIWFSVLAQRQPSLLRDLWTRRGEDLDREKIEHARQELARFLAEKILYGSHQLTRAAVSLDEVHAENRAIEAQG